MDRATKYQLVEKLVNTEDEVILEQIKAILNEDDSDFGASLSEETRNGIQQGRAQIKNGETISHEDVMAEARNRISGWSSK